MTLSTALAQSCDTYFYDVGNRFYERGERERPYWTQMQAWARRFGFGAAAGARHRPRGDRAPADAGVAQGTSSRTDLRQGLEAGRLDPAGDRPEGHPRHAAADGALLRRARQRRQARDAARRLRRSSSPATDGAPPVPLRTFPPTPPQEIGVDPTALARRPRRPLRRDARRRTARRPASSAASRSRSPARRARPRRSSTCPATRRPPRGPVVVVRLGPVRRQRLRQHARREAGADRRLRRDRERRPRRHRRGAGGAEGLRAVLPASRPASRGSVRQ